MRPDSGRSRYWWLAPALGLVVLATVAGGLIARGLYQRPPVGSAAAVAAPASTGAGEPGPPAVTVSPDVASDPHGPAVRQVMQAYFDAINAKSFDRWRAVVTDLRAAQYPTASAFVADYATTRDGNIVLYRVDPVPGNGLRVLLSFDSTQDIRHAPPEFPYPCIHWRTVLPLAWDAHRKTWKVDSGRTANPLRTSC